ncbi:dTDP-4-dehydrorhamnose reductase family protein [Streptomyces achromogenes]|uniref:dTDP-4-dehydrorhamnose reductase family protein n=1 Tax=Streptomyces achromogenes TaxID=67255 RepID=UPI0037CEFC57
MRVLIFGASGLLGRAVMRAFADGHVTGTGFRRQRSGLIRVDATSRDAVWHALDQARPDVVVNCVGERHGRVRAEEPARAHELNVSVARLIAEATCAYGVRLLHISSDYVFDGIAPPYRPDSWCRPQGFYGRLKLLAEDMVRAVHPEAVILRLPMLYGPVEYAAESDITEIAQEVSCGRPVELDDACIRYPTHVDDAAQVCRRLATAQVQGRLVGTVHHWSAQHGFTNYQIGLRIARHFCLPAGHIKAGVRDLAGGDQPVDPRLDCTDLRAVLGWPPENDRTFANNFPHVVAPWVRSICP